MKKFARWLYRLTHRSEIRRLCERINISTFNSMQPHMSPEEKEKEEAKVSAFISAGVILNIFTRDSK